MEIGTIGAGAFAQAFAKRALKAGHTVKLCNDRDPDSLREIVTQLGPGVLLAVRWDNVAGTLASLPSWKTRS
jgi:8-hydroxy-5-deazaflavin:NADPH oxidoreductase